MGNLESHWVGKRNKKMNKERNKIGMQEIQEGLSLPVKPGEFLMLFLSLFRFFLFSFSSLFFYLVSIMR